MRTTFFLSILFFLLGCAEKDLNERPYGAVYIESLNELPEGGFIVRGRLLTHGNSIEDYGLIYSSSLNPTLNSNRISLGPISQDINIEVEALANIPANAEIKFRLYAKTGDLYYFSNIYSKKSTKNGIPPSIKSISKTTGIPVDTFEIELEKSTISNARLEKPIVGGIIAPFLYDENTMKVVVPYNITPGKHKVVIFNLSGTSTEEFYFEVLPTKITGVSATEVFMGDRLTITGENFFGSKFNSTVNLFGSNQTIIDMNRNQITIDINNPPKNTNPLFINLFNYNKIVWEEAIQFKRFTIEDVSTTVAMRGETITLSGTHFVIDLAENYKITVGNVSATVTQVSETSLSFILGNTTPSGLQDIKLEYMGIQETLPFQIDVAVPSFTKILESSFTWNDIITIEGEYLNYLDISKLHIAFNTTKVDIIELDPNYIKVKVPASAGISARFIILSMNNYQSNILFDKNINLTVPKILGIDVEKLYYNRTITVFFENFDPGKYQIFIYVENKNCEILNYGMNFITLKLPSIFGGGVNAEMAVILDGYSRMKSSFPVEIPVIYSLSTTDLKAGTELVITGNYFGPANFTGVQINGSNTIVKSATETELIVPIPSYYYGSYNNKLFVGIGGRKSNEIPVTVHRRWNSYFSQFYGFLAEYNGKLLLGWDSNSNSFLTSGTDFPSPNPVLSNYDKYKIANQKTFTLAGQLYILSTDFIRVDPSTGISTNLPNFPGNTNSYRGYVSDDRYIYVMGGRDITTREATNELYRYDSQNNSWTSIGLMPINCYGGTGYLEGDYLYALNLTDFSKTNGVNYRLNLNNMTWEDLGSHSFGRGYISASTEWNGEFYVFSALGNSHGHITVLKYDKQNNLWTLVETKPYYSLSRNFQNFWVVSTPEKIFLANERDGVLEFNPNQ